MSVEAPPKRVRLGRHIPAAASILGCAVTFGGCAATSAPSGGGSPAATYVPISPVSAPGLVIAAAGCSHEGPLIVYPYQSPHAAGWCGSNQEWELQRLSDGKVSIHAAYGGGNECVSLAGGRAVTRVPITVAPCDPRRPSSSQQFRPPRKTPDHDLAGAYFIVPAGNPRLCLTASSGSAAPEGKITLAPCTSPHATAWHIPAAPLHTETWSYDDAYAGGCNGGHGAGSSLVRRWLTYAETNCGPGAIKALRDCHAGDVTYCSVFQYLDASIISAVSPIRKAPWTESWWLHEPGYTDAAHRLRKASAEYGTEYWLNQSNPIAENWVASYAASRYNAWDGLMMDETAASLRAEFYRPSNPPSEQYLSSQELSTDSALVDAHEQLASLLRHQNGMWFTQVDNGVGTNPSLPTALPLLNHPPPVVGLISEGHPWERGFSPDFATLLDVMASIDHQAADFIVLLSYDPTGTLQARAVQEATVLLGYEPGHVVSWANLEQDNNHLSVWPEEGIYPTNPVQSMAAPGGPGCLDGQGAVCTLEGHADLRVARGVSSQDPAAGVYRREFRDCYNRGDWFGRCAAIVNDTASSVTVRRSWLSAAYAHVITMQGGDVESGGKIDVTGATLRLGVTRIPPGGALLLAQ